jgi:RnfABCDGE-type electron transport complex G subunit
MVKSLQKNNYLKTAATLLILILAAPGLLSVFFHGAGFKIFAQYPRKIRILKEVFPAAAVFKPVREGKAIAYYKAFDRQKNLLGFVFTAFKRGYSSNIVTMAGMDANGIITRIKILSQDETPGLGAKIVQVAPGESEPWFQRQFRGKEAIGLDRSVNAITGATITSKAVIDSIQEKARTIMGKARSGQ